MGLEYDDAPWVEPEDRVEAWGWRRNEARGEIEVVDLETKVVLLACQGLDEEAEQICVAAVIAFNNILYEAKGREHFKELWENEKAHSLETIDALLETLSEQRDEIARLQDVCRRHNVHETWVLGVPADHEHVHIAFPPNNKE